MHHLMLIEYYYPAAEVTFISDSETISGEITSADPIMPHDILARIQATLNRKQREYGRTPIHEFEIDNFCDHYKSERKRILINKGE